jgi:hypothetical protein
MEFIIIWLLFGFVAMIIASGKERDGCGWFILGCLFGPFALVVAALPSLKKDPNAVDSATHGKCPQCAEPILKEAKVCKHCGAQIDGNWRPIVEKKKSLSSGEALVGIIVMIVVVLAIFAGIRP